MRPKFKPKNNNKTGNDAVIYDISGIMLPIKYKRRQDVIIERKETIYGLSISFFRIK